MTKTYTHPFECSQCSTQPKSDFVLFGPVDDYLICYPEASTIHIHFGFPTHDDSGNIAEAEFVQKFFQEQFTKYPNKKFFVLIDFSRGDDSEFVPPVAMNMYKEIISSKHINHGVIYGATVGMNMLMKLLLFATHRQYIKSVGTREAADKVYQAWKQKHLIQK